MSLFGTWQTINYLDLYVVEECDKKVTSYFIIYFTSTSRRYFSVELLLTHYKCQLCVRLKGGTCFLVTK